MKNTPHHRLHVNPSGSQKNQLMAVSFLFIIIAVAAVLLLPAFLESTKPEEEVHIHANFLMVLKGNAKDFSLDSFQSPVSCGIEEKHSDELEVHLHQNNGGVIHVHEKGVTYSDFFASEKITMELSERCLVDENGKNWCNTEKDTWRFFLNGEETPNLPQIVIDDNDSALLLYGYYTPSQINFYQKQIPTDACEYSHTCPTTNPLTEDNCS